MYRFMEYVNKVMGLLPANILDLLYTLSIAFAILIVGWLVAKLVSGFLAKATTKFDII